MAIKNDLLDSRARKAPDTSDELKLLARNIVDLRASLGFSASELSQQIGRSDGYISQIENALISPPIDAVVKIAEVLSVPVSDLFAPDKQSPRFQICRKILRNARLEDSERLDGAEMLSKVKRSISEESGWEYFALNNDISNSFLQAMIVKIPSGSKTKRVFHEGQEVFIVLKGAANFHHLDESAPDSLDDGYDNDVWKDHAGLEGKETDGRSPAPVTKYKPIRGVWFEGHVPHGYSSGDEESYALFMSADPRGKGALYREDALDDDKVRQDLGSLEWSPNLNRYNLVLGIGQRMRRWRLQRDLTLTSLAQLTGSSKSYLSKVERSEAAPSVKQLASIAENLDIRIHDLLPPCKDTVVIGAQDVAENKMADARKICPDSIACSNVLRMMPSASSCAEIELAFMEVELESMDLDDEEGVVHLNRSQFDYFVYVKSGLLQFRTEDGGSSEFDVELLNPGDSIFVARGLKCDLSAVSAESHAYVIVASDDQLNDVARKALSR